MKVYISHTRHNEALAGRLGQALEHHHHEAWLASALVEPGAPVQEVIEDRIRAADALVFLIDHDSQQDRGQILELSGAAEESWEAPDKRMVPVIIGDAPLPAFLRSRNALRTTADSKDWDDVAESIARALSHKTSVMGKPGKNKGALRAEQHQRMQELEDMSKELRPDIEDLERKADKLRDQMHQQQADGAPADQKTAAELADVYKQLGRPADAVAPLETVLLRLAESIPPDEEALARAHMVLGNTLVKVKRDEEARPHMEKAVALYARAHGKDGLPEAFAQLQLATVIRQLGDHDAAAAHRQMAMGAFKRRTKKFLKELPIIGPLFKNAERSATRRSKKQSTTKNSPLKKTSAKKRRTTKVVKKKAAAKKKAASRKRTAATTVKKKTSTRPTSRPAAKKK